MIEGYAEYQTYSNKRMGEISRTITMIVASVLPTLAILALYFVRTPLVRIGLVIVFTAVFSIALTVFTNASAEGVFTSTATYVNRISIKYRKVLIVSKLCCC